MHQLVDGQHLTDDHVGLDVHAHGLQAFDLVLHNGLGQTELGDTVHQHAACQMQSFVHGDLVAQLGQIAGGSQAAGAGTDDGHLMTVGFGNGGGGGVVLTVPVGNLSLIHI